VLHRNKGEVDVDRLRRESESLAADLAAGRRVGREALAEFLDAADYAHDRLGDDPRYELRYALGRLEHLLVRGGRFDEADVFYRVRMGLTRRNYRLLFRDYRDVGALLRSWTYGVWGMASGYGTSALRLGWITFNVAFWFSWIYLALDALAVQFLGERAFLSDAVVFPASYFLIGFEGLFPGTAVFLANNFSAQLALVVENGLGAVLILSWVSLVARRVWRGSG
jgi:hypothetical protein